MQNWVLEQERNRHIFLRGKVIFPDFFPGVKCFFPVENSHFDRPKTNFRRYQKWKAKKKKKKRGPHLFLELILLPFPIFTFPFTIFLLFFSIFTPFPFFPCLFFPDTSAKISRSEVSGGTLPPACYATVLEAKKGCVPCKKKLLTVLKCDVIKFSFLHFSIFMTIFQ